MRVRRTEPLLLLLTDVILQLKTPTLVLFLEPLTMACYRGNMLLLCYSSHEASHTTGMYIFEYPIVNVICL